MTLSGGAARANGVAPLAVFFDATTSSSTNTTRPFHEVEYRWNFGDAAATWGKGSRPGASSKNLATGPVAAHVFESPGTFTITITAFDGTSTATCSVSVTVDDPNVVFAGGNTICFTNGADFTGCPAGAIQNSTTTNFTAAITANATTGKRLLFRRGDTFTAATAAVIGGTGPGLVGAYGSGARPIVQATASTAMLRPSRFNTPGRMDWRIMDLEFDGNANPNVIAIHPDGGIDQLTILRVYAHGVTNAFFFNTFDLDGANAGATPGHTLWDQLAIVDSETANITGFSSALSIYASARRFMLLGNDLNNNGGGEHTVRIPSVVRGVISNNLMQGQAGTKHAFTLRAAVNGSAGVEGGLDTQYVVVSDNKFIGIAGSDQTTMYGPQAATDERVADTLTERNWYVAGGGAGGTQAALQLLAHREQTIRNNLFDTSGGKAHGGITISTLGVIVPDQIRVYNNSFYSTDADNDFLAIRVGSTAITNVTVKNNLAYAPLDTQHLLVDCAGSSSLVACTSLTVSSNSSNAQVLTSPNFSVTPPVTTADWKPTVGSYAIGAGTPVPVWSDFFGLVQPVTRDLGAVIQ